MMQSKGKHETTEYKLSQAIIQNCFYGTLMNKSTCYALVRDLFFFLVVYSTPTSEKASHSYTKTARELIGGIQVKRGTAPPLVNSVTRQFSHVSQSAVTGGLVLDCTYAVPLIWGTTVSKVHTLYRVSWKG